MQPNLPDVAEIENLNLGWRTAHMFSDAKAMRQAGLALWTSGRREAAIELLMAAAERAPDDAAIWNDLAGIFYTAARREKALDAIRRALAIDPNQAHSWLLLATLASDAGDAVAAEAAYGKALALDATLAEASFGLGALYFQQYRFDEAVERLRIAIAQGSHSMALYVCFGWSLFLLGDFAAAGAAFATVVSFPSANAEIIKKFTQLRLTEGLLRGSLEEAIAIYHQAASVDPEDISAVTLTAFHLLSAFGHRDAAIRLGRVRLSWTPDDPMQRYLLAALEGVPLLRAPSDYVTRYFDGFAATFDEKLVGALHYHVPEDMPALIAAQGRRFSCMLDLGCGTGLAGVHLRRLGNRLTGVDLSPRMLDKARERGLYDRLIEADIEDFLAGAQDAYGRERYDLIAAADLLVYFGDLAAVFAGAAALMESEGLFAFSIETAEAGDFALLPSGRFAHSQAYIERLAGDAFHVLLQQPTVIRYEANQPVAGALVILQRR